jgi:hypothetical protein
MNSGTSQPTGSVAMKVIRGSGPRKRPGLIQRLSALTKKDVPHDPDPR